MDDIKIPKKKLNELKKLQNQATKARVDHSLIIEENNRKANTAMKAVLKNEVEFHNYADKLSRELIEEDSLDQFNWHIDTESGKIINLGPVSEQGK